MNHLQDRNLFTLRRQRPKIQGCLSPHTARGELIFLSVVLSMNHRRDQISGWPFWRTISAVVSACLLMSAGYAQDTAPDLETSPASGTWLESLDTIEPGTHLIFKDPVSGRIQRYPAFPEGWLNTLRERADLQIQSQLYDLQNLSITGNIRGEFVELTVEVQIRITVPDEWVRVPLEFSDFILDDPLPEHSIEAPQTGRQRFDKQQQPQKVWQLKGEGIHHLKFHLIGGVRTDSNGRQRIRLTPPVANQSHLLLKLPGIVPTAEIKPAKPLDVRTNEVLGLSEVETWGLSETTEIAWASEAQTAELPTTVQATAPAQMKLDLTTEPGSLSIQQKLSISGGSIDSLTVRLPGRFENVEITGTDAEGAPIDLSVATNEGSAVVSFVAPMTGSIVLDLGLELARNVPDVSIPLPKIEGVTNQMADIEFAIPIGLDVEFSIPEDGTVRQKRVEQNADARAEGVRQAAYRLLSSDAVLKLSIREPEAFYSVVPLVNFETEADSVLLTARFSVNVVRGGFNEMTISWPDYEADGWQILDGYTRLIITDTPPTSLAPSTDGNNVIVQFPARQSRQFVVEMQALRSQQSFQDSAGLLFLPDILAPTPHTTTISLVESDAHFLVLSAQDGQAPFPQLPPSRWPEILTKRKEPLTAWLVDSPGQAVNLDVKPQQSEIRARVLAEVSVLNDSIHLSETITYGVRHRDVRELRLQQGDVRPGVRLSGSDEPLQELGSQGGVVTYGLPRAMRGDFDLRIDYYWTPELMSDLKTNQGGQKLSLPLVLPSSADETIEAIEAIQVVTNTPESMTMSPSDDWGRVHSEEFSAAWSTTTIPESLPMLLKHPFHSNTRRKPQLVVAKSALVGDNFVTAVTAVYSEATDVAVFSMPLKCRTIGATMGGLDAPYDVVATDSGRQLVQVRSQSGEETSTNSATIVVQQSASGNVRLANTIQPLLPRPVGAEADCNCVWVLRQAANSSLFHWSGSMSELTKPLSLNTSPAESAAQVSAIIDVLAPHGDASRIEVMRLLGQTLSEPEQHQLLVGSIFRQPQTLVVFSRRAMLLTTALIGLLMYFAITRLHAVALITVAVLAAALVMTVFAVVPGPAHMMLIRLVPGCVIAVIAGALQRWFSEKPQASLRNLNSSDSSTIFTVDQSLPSPPLHNTV